MDRQPASWFELTSRIAAFGVPGTREEPIEIPSAHWPAVRASVRAQRLTGLAVAALEAGRLGAPEGARPELLADHRAAMLTVLTLERELLALAPIFEEAGIDVLVLKGPAFAHAFYPNASWRAYGDLDLLVRTQDWRTACDVLVDVGYRRVIPEPRPGFDERFGKSATHVGLDGLQIDLHRTLALGAFGVWSDPGMLFGRTASFSLAGRSLRRLDDTGALLHACVHATLGSWPPRLLPLRDVAVIADSASVDWEVLWDLAASWRLPAVIGHALKASSDTLGAPLPPGALAFLTTKPSLSERRLLAAYTTNRRARGGMALSTLRAAGGVRARLAYARALLFPDRAFLHARAQHGGEATYVGRWKVPVRWIRGASGSRRTNRKA